MNLELSIEVYWGAIYMAVEVTKIKITLEKHIVWEGNQGQDPGKYQHLSLYRKDLKWWS